MSIKRGTINEKRETRNFGKNPHSGFYIFIMRDDEDVVPYEYRTDEMNIKIFEIYRL